MDARKERLKQGLNQLTTEQLIRLLGAKESDLCLDTYHYNESYNTRCPMAYALDLRVDSDRRAIAEIINKGYSLCPTSGIEGEFFTKNRYEDLKILIREMILERSK